MQRCDGRQPPFDAPRPLRWALLNAWLCAVLIMLIAMVGSRSAVAEGTVRDIRILRQPGGVRVIVDLSLKAAYSYWTLDGPPRLAIDLPEVSWLVPSSHGTRSIGMVKGYRFGLFKPGVSRLVFDLKSPFEVVRAFELAPNDTSGFRVVVELRALPSGTPVRPARVVSRDAGPPQARPQIERRAGRAVALNAPTRTAVPIPRAKPAYTPARHVIVLDPGHGGVDPGAIGRNGTREKDVVFLAAQVLRRQLEATGHYQVVLTRDDDRFVQLRDRLRVAREAGGELFLSIHADSLVTDHLVSGAAVYTLSERASSEEAARLAATENRADILGGVDLSNQESLVTQILIDLAQRDANNKSIHVANLLVDQLNGATGMLRKDRQQAGFVVLKSPDMPSVLIELGFLSNAEDERRLTDRTHIAKLAKAIVRAVDRFFLVQQF